MTSPVTSLRPLIPNVYLPSLLFEVGIGAITPMLAVVATRLGSGIAGAGLIAALLPIGQILADAPAGALAARFGDRAAMVGSSCAAVVGMALAALAPNLALLGLGVLVVGAANAVYSLARQSYLTEAVDPRRRARAMSTLGGVARIGLFLGPFAGAGLTHLAGVSAPFWLGAGTSVLAAAVLLATREVAQVHPPAAAAAISLRQTVREHRQVFLTLGVAVMLVGAVRGARQTVLPLWTEHLDFEPATTALVFGIAGAVDMLLFYPAGKVMDAFGRLWIAIPSMILMGLCMLALPLTSTLAAVTVVAMLLGLGNGIGSGILMTLGADTAPPAHRSQYLGIWRLMSDSGSALGPLVVSAGAALGSLAGGIAAVGGLAGAAVAALGRWVPRWSVHANRRTRSEAGPG